MCPNFPKNFNGKAYSNVLEVCDICLELPSVSGKCFGFVVEEFSKLSCAYYKNAVFSSWTELSRYHSDMSWMLCSWFIIPCQEISPPSPAPIHNNSESLATFMQR